MTIAIGTNTSGARKGNPVRDAAILTKRNVLRLFRTPQLAVFSTIQPVMFVLLFVYVFGGALKPALRAQGFPYSYPSYLIPGILVQTVLFGGAGTAVGLSEDSDSTTGWPLVFKAISMASRGEGS